MDIENLMIEGSGVFADVKPADITRAGILNVYDKIEEFRDEFILKSDVTMENLYSFCCDNTFLSIVIKELLIGIYSEVYGEDSDEAMNMGAAVTKYSKIDDRLAILKHYVYIDGRNAEGNRINEARLMQTLKRDSENFEKMSNSSIFVDSDDDPWSVVNQKKSESSSVEKLEPMTNTFSSFDAISSGMGKSADTASETAPTMTVPPETALSETAPTMTMPPETALSETAPTMTMPPETAPSEAAPTMTVSSETNFAGTAPVAEISSERPIIDDSRFDKIMANTASIGISFDPAELPRDISKADDYYLKLKSNVTFIEAQTENGIYYSTSIDNKISRGSGISASDDIKITVNINNDKIAKDFLLLINDEGSVAVLGNFLPSSNSHKYYIEAHENNIIPDKLKPQSRIYTLIFSNEAHTSFYRGTIRINCVELEMSDKVLCVDFGTSNTTAGIYTNEGIRTVKFMDVTDESHPSSTLCPTLVYVKDIRHVDLNGYADDVEYLFGYEAKKVLLESGYDPEGDMFFEIKRWILTPNKKETIWDGKTNAYIRRRDIIKGYLRYILKCAESDMKCRFRNFHFSAPVKLKGSFIQVLKEYVFPAEEGFSVMEAEDSIDEGVAIVYNHISESIIYDDINNTENSGEHEESIIIIDCGGGTTDLVSSRYHYEKTATGYDLDLETRFENGNSNFGGNNLTYRIFQLLKIKLCHYYDTSGDIDIYMAESFFSRSGQNDVLNEVDKCVESNTPLTIYDKLDIYTSKCEDILPTDFGNGSDYAMETNTRHQVKRNFYFLWQLAEEIKIRFFTVTSTVEITLDDQKETVIPIDVSNIYYYIKNPDGDFPPLVSTKDIKIPTNRKPVNITVNEINMLIRPDIYYLLSNIFKFNSEHFDDNNYSKIKLSGQSCKISLFQDLLKEFVPGRKLRDGKLSDYSSSDPMRLKMECVHGCIAYVRDRNYHLVKVNNIPVSQNIIYSVKLSRGIGVPMQSGVVDPMSRILFNGADFRTENGRKVASPLHIESFSPSPGQFRLTVLNTAATVSVEHNMDIDIEYKPEKRIFLDDTDAGGYFGINGKTLREKMKAFSYNNINDYKVTGDENKEGVVDNLIRRIREYEVAPGMSTVLVFAVPNNEGYGFVLYQIIKTVSETGEVSYYEACWKQIPFDTGMMSKSFFNGKNCRTIPKPDKK